MARVSARNIKERTSSKQTYIPSKQEREAVVNYMAIGLNLPNIARIMRVNIKTLRKYYAYEIETGKNNQIAKVAQTLFQIATDPSHPKVMSAAIFFLKTRAGWSEKINLEVTGPDGGPIQHQHNIIDPRSLSLEQREQLREIVQAQLTHQGNTEDDEGDDYHDADFVDVEPEGNA